MIVILTGSPGAGKSTVAGLLAQQFERSVVIPIDDVREWVKAGISHPVDWCDETERQFRLAEAAACSAARIYEEGGFVVILDQCRNIERWEEMIGQHMAGSDVRRFALKPSLEVNLDRNARRTHKGFDTLVLTDIIRYTHEHNFDPREGWHVLETSAETPEQTTQRIVGLLSGKGTLPPRVS